MDKWTTEDHPPHEQFSYWREVLCAAFVSLNPIAKERENLFAGQVTSRSLAQTARLITYSKAQLVNRGHEEIRENPVEYCFANFQLQGDCVVRQDGRETLVSPGEFSIVDSTRPYFLDFKNDWRTLSFRIPRDHLVSKLATPDLSTARCVDARSGLGLVANQFARSLQNLNENLSLESQTSLSNALHIVIAAALGATDETQERDRAPLRAAFRQAVESFITMNLTDPMLGPDMIATRFNVSRRTLYVIFEDAPVSISSMIRNARLENAANEILKSQRGEILEVAMRWGFNDAAHFSRLFKSHFGVSPREYAATGRRERLITR